MTVTSPEVCRRARITYRQLDYWCRTSMLHPVSEGVGQGSWRQFPESELVIAGVARMLIDAGFRTEPALVLARRIQEQGDTFDLANGLLRTTGLRGGIADGG